MMELNPYNDLMNGCGAITELNNNIMAAADFYNRSYEIDFNNSNHSSNDNSMDDLVIEEDEEGEDDDYSDRASTRADRVKRIIDNSGRKRRIYSTIHNDPKQSTRRFRANDRERRRMNSLNGALQALKGCVPSYHGKKRLTKLQILKFACHYISDLSELLCSDGNVNSDRELNKPCFTDTINSNNGSYGDVDAFVNMMVAEQQHQHFLDSTSQMQSSNMVEQNVNGLSMMQRLDYLTLHSYMACNSTNENLNVNTAEQGHSGGLFSSNMVSPGSTGIYNYS